MASFPDDTFVRFVLQNGIVNDAQVAQARQRQATALGEKPVGLAEVMVSEGIITREQREKIEQRISAQNAHIQQLGKFKLIKKIGEGGMGAVYLAEDTFAFRKVALKLLHRKYAGSPDFLARFRREAQAMARLNHANIVAAFDVAEEKGYHFYVMEYCEGEPLDVRLRREKRLPIDDCVDIIIQVARGLEYAHARNTIHRDIKPGNIFMMTDGTAKILDLGLSKNLAEADTAFNTQAGVTVGTPHYISPEQARGDANMDGRTDIYSLGATLYHLITGRTPFEGPTSVVIMTKHLTEQLENPADLRPEIPDGLVHIIIKAMAKDRDDRYLNCAEMLEDLERVKSGGSPSSAVLDPVRSSVSPRVRRSTGQQKPLRVGSSGPHLPIRETGKGEPIIAREEPREQRPTDKPNAVSHPQTMSAQQKSRMALIVGVSGAVLASIAIWFAMSGGSEGKSNVVSNPTPTPPAPTPQPEVVTPPPVQLPPDDPATQAAYSETISLLRTYLRNREFARARERLTALEREVSEHDPYDGSWCKRLEEYETSVAEGERHLRIDFRNMLLNDNFPPSPPGWTVLFSSNNYEQPDARIKCSKRVVKSFRGKAPFLDGQDPSRVLTFEASGGVLIPPGARLMIEYLALSECNVTVKYYEDPKKPSGEESKAMAATNKPAHAEFNVDKKGFTKVSRIDLEFAARPETLAVYRILVLLPKK
jgi:serine/threonine-protein kinase